MDGELTVFRRFPSGLSVLRRAPAAVGFVSDLYSNPSDEDEERRQLLESRFFKAVDNEAALALNYMEDEKSPPSCQRKRSAWARFLMSLMHRSPGRIRRLHREAHGERERIIGSVRENRPEAQNLSDGQILGSEDLDILYLNLVQDLVNSTHIGTHLVGMTWAIISFNFGNHSLLSSDRPLVRSSGVRGEAAFLILPISPNACFVAANHDKVLDYFSKLSSKNLSMLINNAVVKQAEEFVISVDESQARFIDNRLLRTELSRDSLGDVTWAMT